MEIIIGSITTLSLITLAGGLYCLVYSSRLIREEEERQRGDGGGYPL